MTHRCPYCGRGLARRMLCYCRSNRGTTRLQLVHALVRAERAEAHAERLTAALERAVRIIEGIAHE